MLRFIKVTGDSLSPEFQEGDFVLVSKIPFSLSSIREGDIVVFNHPEYGIMIKKVAITYPQSGEYFVVGTHGHSVDSRRFGNISRKDLVGKVIWHIRHPR
jgi:nickel-type superoxide dismutase maturation protease